MTLLDTALRACWPALMATRTGRRLPGVVARALGPAGRPAFLAAVKRVNAERLSQAEARGFERFDAYPSFITVAGTSRCNIRCEFCINQWDAKPDGSNRPHMRDDHVQRVVREVFPYLKKLALSVSGEPLYDPHFQELLDEARRYGVFVEFTTNAMLVSKPGMLDRILDGVGRVNISMDGATKGTYERLRQGAKFDKVCDNVRLLTEGREKRGQRTPEYNLRFILMKDTIDELPAMVDLAKDLGVDHLFTNHVQVFMQALEDQSLVHHKTRANRALAAARERAAARNMVVVLPPDFDESDETQDVAAAFAAAPAVPATAAEIPGEAWAGTGQVPRAAPRPAELPPSAYLGRCPYLWEQAFFEADGSVFPCCNAGGVALGHLDRSPDFWAIWTGAPYAAMRASVYTSQCHDICVNCYLREGVMPSEAFVRPVEGAAVGGW